MRTLRRARAAALGILAAAPLAAQAPAPGRTYCNPLDLDYKYNFEQLNERISYRSGADPVLLTHRGAYYLFSTIAGGYWRSTDLAEWRFVRPSRWPMEDVVAPAALAFGDTIVLKPSTFEVGPILYTTSPATGQLEFYNRWLPPLPDYNGDSLPGRPGAAGPWDPAFFRDDDGRWFLYYGSSNVYPLFGLELDPRRRLTYAGRPVPLLRLDPDRHGWERFGQDHRSPIRPFVEGAWMTKHAGRYYLQYGAPGTEYNVYATGTYVGDAPLGPFVYAPYNPVAYKPGGFVTGAGHGNAFQDLAGNWWLTGTPWLGSNWPFERRIALFPAWFDADGQYSADTRFGDLPHRVPRGRLAARGGTFTGWMLLSYRKPARASSTGGPAAGDTAARGPFPAALATDEDPRTFWLAGANRAGEWLDVDLGGVRTVRAVQVNYADYRQGLYASDSTVYTRFRLLASDDGRRWRPVADLARGPRRDRPNAYVELARSVRARWIRYQHVYTAGPHLALGALRVFGTADGPPPAAPAWARARRGGAGRDSADARDMTVTWAPVPGAVGYNVRWGVRPDRLYQTYQLWADRGPGRDGRLEVRALTAGVGYHVAVEAFDERGVSTLTAVVAVP